MKKVITAIFNIAAASFTVVVLSTSVQSQNSSENTAQKGYAGFAIEDDEGFFQPIDELSITQITYTGECPGYKYESEDIVFISDNTPTSPDRRVIITNVAETDPVFGRVDVQPYTDREYEQDEISEDIKLTIGSEHRDKRFVVREGENKFKYEIVQIEEKNDQEFEVILEEDFFSMNVNKPVEFKERNKIGENRYDSEGNYIYTDYVCPKF